MSTYKISHIYHNTNGDLHREDGPAIEWADGDKHWYIDGELHRVDGPAIERADGSKAWCISDMDITSIKYIIVIIKYV